jgi:hypothetical protein
MQNVADAKRVRRTRYPRAPERRSRRRQSIARGTNLNRYLAAGHRNNPLITAALEHQGKFTLGALRGSEAANLT